MQYAAAERARLSRAGTNARRTADKHRTKDRIDDVGERDVRCGPEPARIAQLELRAPQHNVEVIGDRLEIAIDWRRGQRLQLLANLLHAIGHHAEWDEVFPNILCLQIPLLQSCNQRLGIVRQNIGLRSGEEVDRFAWDGDNVRENTICRVW